MASNRAAAPSGAAQAERRAAAVSLRALMVLFPMARPFAQAGTRPHCIGSIWRGRLPVLMGMTSCGATLYARGPLQEDGQGEA
jgi:hypothetical protein